MLSDIDGQKPTLDAVNDSARELLNSSNQRLAKKIESKLKEANLRFEKLCEKAQKRSDLLEEVRLLYFPIIVTSVNCILIFPECFSILNLSF